MLPTDNEKPCNQDTLGGELRQGWDSTELLKKRVESFAILKHRAKSFIDWALQGGVPLLQQPKLKSAQQTVRTFRRLQDCGQYLIFRNYLVSLRSRLIGACSCKQHLLCAFCASRRGVKNAMAYKEKVDYLAAENLQKDNTVLHLLLITFTVKNGSDLWERFTHLRESMQTLLRHRNDQSRSKDFRGKHQTEMFKLSGGAFAYEFKRGDAGQWHPHIHMLAHIRHGSMLDAAGLKAEWLEITGDSSVINIKYCENDQAFLEVFAYALKFSEMSHPDRWGASQLLKCERLISSFGSFRGVDLADDVTDDILATEEPFVDLLFRWTEGRTINDWGYGMPAVINQSQAAA